VSKYWRTSLHSSILHQFLVKVLFVCFYAVYILIRFPNSDTKTVVNELWTKFRKLFSLRPGKYFYFQIFSVQLFLQCFHWKYCSPRSGVFNKIVTKKTPCAKKIPLFLSPRQIDGFVDFHDGFFGVTKLKNFDNTLKWDWLCYC
jgi:hypothetical protein